jgi:hypothetical protein
MPSYLDYLPDDIMLKIYQHVHDRAVVDTVKLARRRITRQEIPVWGKKTNSRVIYSWMNGKPFKSLNMFTNGLELYSYALMTGRTDPDGSKVLRDYTAKGLGCYSQTTSQQVNLVRPYADVVESI